MTDWQLIEQFRDHDSQAAFAELLRRYTDLVYCTCLRELSDPTLAEDAAQAVFLILARKAPSLRPNRQETTLSSWLFQTALLTSKNALRREGRRQAREQEAAMQQSQTEAEPGWIEAEPLLNDALRALPSGQRALILERFFQERPLAVIGAVRGISEDAARMRVNRALDRLRRFFAARNVVLPAAALAALLPQAVHPAPAQCAKAIGRLGLPSSGPPVITTPAHTIAQGAIHTMNSKRLRLQLGAAAIVAALSLGTAGAVRITTQAKARTVLAEKQQDQARALAVLDRMYATYTAMHSFRCEVTSREITTGTEQLAAYEIQRPNKVRFHRASLVDVDGTGRAAAVSDGSNLYVTCTEGNGLADRYAKIPVGSPWVRADFSAGMLFAIFGGLNRYGTEPDAGMPDVALGVKTSSWVTPQQSAPEYSLGQPVFMDERVNGWVVKGARVDVVSFQRDWIAPADAVKEKPLRVTYYIGQRDHLLYKLTVSAVIDPTHSELIRTEDIEDFDTNPKLAPADFIFTPPPGSHEVHNTSDLFPGGKG